MKLDNVLSGIVGSSGDPGAFLKKELEQGLGPVLERVDRLEKKLDLLILAINRVEGLLKSIQPMVALLKKLPFLK